MSKESLLVRMDINNTQNNLVKVLWFIATDESAAKAWLNEMEFEHVEMANDAGGGASRGGMRFSESRLIPIKDVNSMRLSEMGQITLGDLFSLFALMSEHSMSAFAESQAASAAEGGGSERASKAKPAGVKRARKPSKSDPKS